MNNIYHVIKDPVHGTMQFTSTEDAWVKPFIDSPHFQRLRHIKQLGMGDFIFPGAVHTRFNHCLGCCYVAGQIAHKIGLAEEERQLVMIAGLLHDIGHGPFSHAFEDIFFEKCIRHEAWTPYFLADYTADFFENYNRLNPNHPLSPEKFAIIAKMIMHQPIPKSLLADIVSSQLDADRLDYLLRDSHFCGVRYGEFDFRWMLHCMAIVKGKNGERIGITHKGIGVVEHYLMARRLMIRNIYHGQKKLALEALLVHLLANLAQNLDKEPAFAAIRDSRLGAFLLAVNQFNEVAESGLSKPQLEELKECFLQENYANYKGLCDYDMFVTIKHLTELSNDHAATQIATRLHHRKMPKIVRLGDANFESVQAELQVFKANYQDIQDWQLFLIQTPHRSYSREEDPILVINEHHQVQPINKFSLTINAISDKLEQVVFLSIDSVIVDDARVKNLISRFQENAVAIFC